MSRNTRRPSAHSSAYFELDLGGEELTEIEFTGLVEIVDNGIGSYECHGYKGRDVQLEPECENYEWDRKLYREEENLIIEKWEEENSSKIIDKLIENADLNDR